MANRRALPGQFSLYRRNGTWYYWTYDDYGGRHRFSTYETDRQRAFSVCLQRVKDGTLVWEGDPNIKPKTALTLSEYGVGFWDYDTSRVIQDKLQRGGHFTRKLASTYAGFFKNHIADSEIGRKLMARLTKADINEWLLSLKSKGLAPKTANNVLVSLRSMLNQAVEEGLLERSPAESVKPLIGQGTRRGCFTLEQIRLLFDGGWGRWGDKFTYAGCFLASRTGMRMGEVLALQPYQIQPGSIIVDASWSEEDGRKCTKSGWGREVPITSEIYWMLMEICPPTKEGYIFTRNGINPVKDDILRNALRDRMEAINSEHEEKGLPKPFDLDGPNPLTFHSFRHFLNTRLVAEDIPQMKIQAIIGHESAQMTEHYAHLDAEDLRRVKTIQENLA